MRDILFRGKRLNDGKWIIGNCTITKFAAGDDRVEISGFLTGEYFFRNAVDPATVGQYTGLKDTNGKKIFEGDIVQEKGDIFYGVVRFGEYTISSNIKPNHYGVYIEWLTDKDFKNEIKFWLRGYPIEVVGNIHDNPELLGNETQI